MGTSVPSPDDIYVSCQQDTGFPSCLSRHPHDPADQMAPDFIKFNNDEYREKVKACSIDELRNKIYKHTRILWGSETAHIVAAATAGVTMGMTNLASGVARRRVAVATQKLGILEDEWHIRGLPALRMRKRDILIPVAAGLVTAGHGTGFEHIAITHGANLLATYGMKAWDRRGSSELQDSSQSRQHTADTDLVFEEFTMEPNSDSPPDSNRGSYSPYAPKSHPRHSSTMPGVIFQGSDLSCTYGLPPPYERECSTTSTFSESQSLHSFTSTPGTSIYGESTSSSSILGIPIAESPTQFQPNDYFDESGRYKTNKTILKARRFSAAWKAEQNFQTPSPSDEPQLSYEREYRTY